LKENASHKCKVKKCDGEVAQVATLNQNSDAVMQMGLNPQLASVSLYSEVILTEGQPYPNNVAEYSSNVQGVSEVASSQEELVDRPPMDLEQQSTDVQEPQADRDNDVAISNPENEIMPFLGEHKDSNGENDNSDAVVQLASVSLYCGEGQTYPNNVQLAEHSNNQHGLEPFTSDWNARQEYPMFGSFLPREDESPENVEMADQDESFADNAMN